VTGTTGVTGATGTVTYTNSEAAGDTAITGNSTYVDVSGCSASLAAGTYIALVTVQAKSVNANTAFLNTKVTDGTNEFAVNRHSMPGTNVSGEDEFHIHSQPIVLGGTTGVKLQAACNATGVTVLQKTAGLNTGNIVGTRITFIKVT
jgi:hypothetical protein